MKQKRIVISGGGTGGHLYPALAVGRQLKEKDPDLLLTYIGTTRDVEKEIMEEQGVRHIPLRVEGLKGKGLKSARSFILLPPAFAKSLLLHIRLRPKLVVGVGGYSSGPVVLAAAWLKIPTLILEQNAWPGLTNRLLLPWVKKAVAAFESSLPAFKGKGVFLGNPVREEFFALPPKKREEGLTLLVFGGSQGSSFLNKCIMDALPLLSREMGGLKIIHQTGPADLETVRQCYERSGFGQAVLSAYFHNMAELFGKADLIICRAGATTCAELIASQKASLLIPFAKAADNHQVLNAREMEKAGGAEVILEDEVTPERLAERILFYTTDKRRLDAMERNLESLKTLNATENIVQLCFELMERMD
jgi:UDP-N-acetylglucosamine--N-acetylmuramyl-(pentapeptide) pyrophosphoryl-undecaprenol N-acetylglucosamine transferase